MLLGGGEVVRLLRANSGSGGKGQAEVTFDPAHPGPVRQPPRRTLALLWAWTALTVSGLALIAIPWQRYYLPLAPIACLWAAYGLSRLTWLSSLVLSKLRKVTVTW